MAWVQLVRVWYGVVWCGVGIGIGFDMGTGMGICMVWYVFTDIFVYNNALH